MRAYASMYRPFRPTAISGHTRLTSGHTRVISGHKMAETYHAILPLLQYTVKQETNKKIKQSDSHNGLLKTLRNWAGKQYYRSLRMAIHKETKKSVCSKEKWNNLKSNHKSTFYDGRASAHDLVLMGACALDSALMGASARNLSSMAALATSIFRSCQWSSIVHGISSISVSQKVVRLTMYLSAVVLSRALVQCFCMLYTI